MAKSIGVNLQAHIKQHGSTIATCWKLIRRDGQIFGFTDCTFDLTIAAQLYSARTGYTRSAISSNSRLSVDNLDIEGLVSNAGITDLDLRSGLYDFARLEIFLVNYLAPGDGVVPLRSGVLGDLTMERGVYRTEVRGLAQLLTRVFMEIVSPDCTAMVYDGRCKVDPVSYTNTGTVDSVLTDRSTFEVTLAGTVRASGYFNHGLLEWDTGDNTSFFMEVKNHTSDTPHTFDLFLPMHAEIKIGDTFTIKRGCGKIFDECVFFDNTANFRGFNKVPGPDILIKTPDARD